MEEYQKGDLILFPPTVNTEGKAAGAWRDALQRLSPPPPPHVAGERCFVPRPIRHMGPPIVNSRADRTTSSNSTDECWVKGMSGGREDSEASASLGIKRRDLEWLRWSPNEGPSFSMMWSTAAKSSEDRVILHVSGLTLPWINT